MEVDPSWKKNVTGAKALRLTMEPPLEKDKEIRAVNNGVPPQASNMETQS